MLGFLSVLGAAHAQDQSIDFELFRPVADGYGYVAVPSSATLAPLQIAIASWWSYENDPIILAAQGARVIPGLEPLGGNDNGEGVVDDRFLSNAQLAMGLTGFLSIALDLPIVAWQEGYDVDTIFGAEPPRALLSDGFGDLRIQPKLVAFDVDTDAVGLAFFLPVALPTGGSDYLGEDGASAAPSAVVEIADGTVHDRKYRIRLAVTAGYHLRPTDRIRDVTVGDGALFGAAVGVHPLKPLEIDVDFHGEAYTTAQTAAEADAGVHLFIVDAICFTVGGGFGTLPGIGAPDFRIVSGISVAQSLAPGTRDRDADGITDAHDRCPREREDSDMFEDGDGCPEPDNDRDGITDAGDPCPNEAEDADGWQDGDGCPDADNDGDGMLDAADRCPNEAEVRSGWQDDDGCPDAPPVPDTNAEQGRVTITQDSLKIDDRIFFETGNATIARQSFQLLDEIAHVIGTHPELRRIRIEGHTDGVGSDAGNLALSQSRADAVKAALVERGIEGERLDAQGFGESRPIDTNQNESGRASNRRVELIIVERAP